MKRSEVIVTGRLLNQVGAQPERQTRATVCRFSSFYGSDAKVGYGSFGSSLRGPSRAIESADLNLKLMRWRFLPNLDTESLSHVIMIMTKRRGEGGEERRGRRGGFGKEAG